MDTKHTTRTACHSGLKIPSSWITSVRFKPNPDPDAPSNKGYLAVFTKQGTAFLHSDVPSYLAGLVQAGKGGRSVGSAYHNLVRSQNYPTQYVTEEQKVRELKEMMK